MKPYPRNQVHFYKSFSVTGVYRADLKQAGFDAAGIDDGAMSELASKMANAHCETGFWEDLEAASESLGIRKKK